MALDATLAYFHFAAIFVLFGYMVAEAVLLRGTLGAETIQRLARIDLIYFGAAILVLVTGFLRLMFGAKGADFYLSWWPIYAKIGTFLVIACVSIVPTLAFIRWRRMASEDPAWQVPAAEQKRIRRFLTIELHLAALIPAFAVVMARGLGR
jgi:putative membrane protein